MTDEKFEKVFKDMEQVFQQNKLIDSEAFNCLMCVGLHLLIKSGIASFQAQQILESVKLKYIEAREEEINALKKINYDQT